MRTCDFCNKAAVCVCVFFVIKLLCVCVCVSGQKVSNLSELQLNVTHKNLLVVTDQGTRLTTDLIISCIGLKINSAAYASSFRKSCEPISSQLVT